MSPRWGLRIFTHAVCYKHVAPLGLNEPMNQLRFTLYVSRLLSCKSLNPENPDSDKFLLTHHVSLPSRMSPRWGFRFDRCVCYTHCAPLERGDWTYRLSIDISLRWSENLRLLYKSHSAKLCSFYVSRTRFYIFYSSRPAGACGYLHMPCAINMSPRWGFESGKFSGF